jgi:tRNA dimethylallyltransferase
MSTALLTATLPLPDRTRPVLLAGPTASGKSALALYWAIQQNRVIVNADALQVYDMWDVLSARPPASDLKLAPHHLYGHVGRGDSYSVGHWLRNVEALLQVHSNPVIVGGTGLYFSALTDGLAVIPAIPSDVRSTADARMALDGRVALLSELDAATAQRIDPLNPARVQRAWEVLHATGRGLAEWQAETGPALLPLHQSTAYVLQPSRESLANRIDQRFDLMIDAGALKEARAALPHWEPSEPWARAIGAPELVAHLRHEISLSEAIATAKLATRQYAKRQRTWFRNRLKLWQQVPMA